MSADTSHKKARAVKLTADEKKAVQMAQNRRAQLQWYLLAAVITIAVLGAIGLVLLFTDGEIGGHGG